VLDSSITVPGTLFLYSRFTGSVKCPPRTETKLSENHALFLLKIEFSFDFICSETAAF